MGSSSAAASVRDFQNPHTKQTTCSHAFCTW
jgi:hypothetical protein